MTPEVFERFLRVAREGGAAAFEVGDGGLLRVTMAPAAGMAVRRPRPGEVESRLGDVDEELLYASAGGR